MNSTHLPKTPTVETPVGDLIARQPGGARLLDMLGVNYCCGGHQSLEEACAQKAIDPQTLLSELLTFTERDPDLDDADWSKASLTELADHIEATHHDYLKTELPRLHALVRKVAAVHGMRHPWMLEVDGVFAAFAGQTESHMLKEEQMLFPLIRQLESEFGEAARVDDDPAGDDQPRTIADLAGVMEREHKDAGAALSRMHRLSSGYTPPSDACNAFRAVLQGLAVLENDTHHHIMKENSILFSKAIEMERIGPGRKQSQPSVKEGAG